MGHLGEVLLGPFSIQLSQNYSELDNFDKAVVNRTQVLAQFLTSAVLNRCFDALHAVLAFNLAVVRTRQ